MSADYDYATEGTSRPEPCCRNLCAKSLYYRADERPGMIHPSDTMDYWCGVSGSDLGPDGGVAAHGSCQSGRPCFEPEEGSLA